MQEQGCLELSQRKRPVPREFLGAFKAGHRRTAREFIDEDFAKGLLQLAEQNVLWAMEALQWLTKFNNEYHKCVFRKDGSDIHDGGAKWQERYNAQNARQRDCMTKRGDYDVDRAAMPQSEDDLIAALDLKREMEKAKKQ